MLKTLYIETHGCQMNEYDSARMFDLLKATHGLEPTSTPETADVILLNTCSIRERAQEKVFSELGRWRLLKQARPHILIGVGGCVASQEGAAIRQRAPYVDLVFGPQTLHRVPHMINEILTFKNPIVDISFPEIEKFDKLPDPTAQGPTAFVSIMEGCSQYCSYCVVPYTRGEEIHRPFEDILHEVAVLTQQGVREITLLGQNVNAYQGTLHTGQPADLALLIQYLAEFDTIDRIRFMTSHPLAFTERLLAAYAEIPKLADHLHLPVQSGSDRILMQMKRGHTTQAYREKIQHLRQIRPHISLTSDFIVGFPGETDADFQETLDFVQEMNFDQSFCFIYSKRPGTLAAAYADTVTQEVKKARLAQLQALLHQQALRFSQNLHHTVQDVLVLHAAKKHPGQLTGRTTHNRMVHFTGGSTKLIGSMTRVCITETMANILKGEWFDH